MDMKTQYTPRSWNAYNKALVERGNITIWLDRDTLRGWFSARRPGVQGGRREVFSDSAILALMYLKSLFRMPYRMLEGFARSLLILMKCVLPIPHFTRICQRSKKLNVPKQPRGKKVTDIVIDGSGVKIYGEGEWKVEQHGREGKRKWKKIHVAMDPDTHEVILTDVTESGKHDSQMLPVLLEKVEGRIGRVYGDGAYDTRKCYQAILERGGEPVIPPRKTAKIWHSPEQWAEWRNRAVRERRGLGLDEVGLSLWKKLKRYGSRSLVETYFSRFKRAFGDRAYSKKDESIGVEIELKTRILNRFVDLGMPFSQPI
jgi:DDE family transposase